MRNELLPMYLQFFAADGGGAGQGAGTGGDGASQGQAAQQNHAPATAQGQQSVQIDYDKLAQIIAGKQSATEDSVLKGYFRQQGLSQEEMTQAIQAFKAQKAASQPDVNALQTQAQTAQAEAQKAMVEKEAVLEAVQLGIDAKTIPYVLKIADLSGVVGQDGKVSSETLKKAINKVLEDIPQLKPAQEAAKGFQIGGGGQQGASQEAKATVPAKRWNRFNN